MMAVVTTMLTSPILHFVWIRNEEKKKAPHIHGITSFIRVILVLTLF